MKEIRGIEITGFLEGYYMCLVNHNTNKESDNWLLAIEATKDKYNKMPLYRSALTDIYELDLVSSNIHYLWK